MSLLREIQKSLMDEEGTIGPIMLKLRFLASRLGNANLEEWVKFESEGYPTNADVPDYRKIQITYKGNFSGPYGSGIQNAPIPPYVIEKYAGKHWVIHELRQSISAIDSLVGEKNDKGGTLSIDSANLILLLQGHIYEGYACNSISGTFSVAQLAELQYAVRSRILELTLELEKAIPYALDIKIGPENTPPNAQEAEVITHIAQQIVHGNVTTISNSGAGAKFQMNISAGNLQGLIDGLVGSGLPLDDATEFAHIVASEGAESKDEPFGQKAKAWITNNIYKATNGTWNVGIAVATNLLTAAAMKYYGYS